MRPAAARGNGLRGSKLVGSILIGLPAVAALVQRKIVGARRQRAVAGIYPQKLACVDLTAIDAMVHQQRHGVGGQVVRVFVHIMCNDIKQ